MAIIYKESLFKYHQIRIIYELLPQSLLFMSYNQYKLKGATIVAILSFFLQFSSFNNDNFTFLDLFNNEDEKMKE